MKKKRTLFLFVGLLLILITWLTTVANQFLVLDQIRLYSEILADFVNSHYSVSIAVFAAVILVNSFFLPGNLVLALASGFLFGPWLGGAYITLFSTVGSMLAFCASRYLIGNWIQKRYEKTLTRFNREVSAHGVNYIVILRILPVIPDFLISYLSGVTRMRATRFVSASVLGFLPGGFIYAFAGRQLRTLRSLHDVLTLKMTVVLILIVLVALLPVVHSVRKKMKSRKCGQTR